MSREYDAGAILQTDKPGRGGSSGARFPPPDRPGVYHKAEKRALLKSSPPTTIDIA